MARGKRRRKSATPAPSAGTDAAALTELQRRQRRIDRNAAAAAAPPGEPTPEQLAKASYGRREIHDPDSGKRRQARVVYTSTIDRYRARKLISERQWHACAKYHGDYARGGYERPITGRYEGGGGSAGSANMSGLLAANNAQIDARARWLAARDQVPRPLRDVFDRVVCHGDDAVAAGTTSGMAGRAANNFALFTTRIAGDVLADFYRL